MKKILNNKYIHIPLFVMLFTFIAYMVSDIYFDNDGYWIIASGKYIVNHGIPTKNPFTFIKDLNIIIQQWPWAIFCYKVYSQFGNLGLYICTLLIFLADVIMFSKLTKLKNANVSISTLFTLLIFCFSYIFISIRPTMLTVFLLISEIYVLEYYKQTEKKSVLGFLILISFFEINLHSAIWFFHFVFMLPYIVPPIKNPFVKFKEDDMKRKPLFFTMIPMFLVGFLNPYGIKGMLYIVYSFGNQLKNAGISELECWTLKSFYGLIIIITILIVTYILKKKKIDSATFYLFCGTTIMGFMYKRNLIYFIFGLIILFIELIKDIDFTKINTWFEKQIKYTCCYVWLVIVIFCILFGKSMIHTVLINPEEMNVHPVKCVQYLDNKNVDKQTTKIYTEFNSGGYFEFKDYHCFIDARPELYFKKLNKKQEVFKDYDTLQITSNISKLEKILQKYQFDYLCVSVNTNLDTYLKLKNNYKIVQKDKKTGFNLYQKIN